MAQKIKKTSKEAGSSIPWPFGPRNYLLFAVALVVIVIGYVILGQGSITLAPILLVFGYVILIPLALIVRDKKVQDENSAEDPVE